MRVDRRHGGSMSHEAQARETSAFGAAAGWEANSGRAAADSGSTYRMPSSRSTRIVPLIFICLFLAERNPARLSACDPNPDPLGLAGPHVLFMNNCTQGTSIVANNAHTRAQAMNPYTPLRDPFGLRITDSDSKLVGATAADPVGDTIYIRGGVYEMPLITVFNRVIFWHEHNIKIKAYPGERVIIRGSTFVPGGPAPNTHCNPIPGQGLCLLNHMFQFWNCDDAVVEGITFVGNTNATVNIAGLPVTGKLFQPYVLRFWECDRLTLRNLSIVDHISINDIGLGRRYLDDLYYAHTEYMARSLTVSYSSGLEMDQVFIDASPDDPSIDNVGDVPWNMIGFITESLLGTPSEPIRIHGCTFKDCTGNAVELSTVVHPQRHVVFERNEIDNWKNGILISGSGLNENLVIRNNRIRYNHCWLPVWANRGYAIQISDCAAVTIANNIIYDAGLDGCGIELVAGLPNATAQTFGITNTSILHNTLYRAGSQGISIWNKANYDGAIPINRITGTRVINNLIYKINPALVNLTNLNNSRRELFLQFPNFEENNGYGNLFWNNLFVPERSDGKSIGSANFGHWMLNGSILGAWQCYATPEMPGCGWHTCAPSAGCEYPTRYKYTGASFNSLQPYAQNNIEATSAAPMFVNPDKANFRLVAGSPAINQAIPLPELLTDFDGVVRAQGGGCTIGAFEFDPPVMGDLTCDSQVTQSDVSAMVLALISPATYSQSYTCLQNGDINQDQKVDGRDIRGFVDIITP